MYKVFMTYFGYYLNATFDSKEKAIAVGKETGFSFTVFDSDGLTVGFYEPIGGWRGL